MNSESSSELPQSVAHVSSTSEAVLSHDLPLAQRIAEVEAKLGYTFKK